MTKFELLNNETEIYLQYSIFHSIERQKIDFITQQQQKLLFTTLSITIIWIQSFTLIIKINIIGAQLLIGFQIILSGVLLENIWSNYNVLNYKKNTILGIPVSQDTFHMVELDNQMLLTHLEFTSEIKFSIFRFLPYGNKILFDLFCIRNNIDEKAGITLILADYFKAGENIKNTLIDLPYRIVISVILFQVIRSIFFIPFFFLFGNIYGDVFLVLLSVKLVGIILSKSKLLNPTV